MADYSIHEHLRSINNNLTFDDLLGVLGQAQALSEISVTSPEFMEMDKKTIHHFLWTLNRLIAEARRYSETLNL